jgi:hypothetical protein
MGDVDPHLRVDELDFPAAVTALRDLDLRVSRHLDRHSSA